jgi:predicted ATPase
VIGKDELLAAAWPGGTVADANLWVHIAALRKVLGGGADGRGTIKNVIGRGYCFVAPVERVEMPRRDIAAAAQSVTTRLPARPPHVIGRDRIIEDVAARLPRRRLVTIVGPGGIGKTTVGLAVAGLVADTYRDGVCFVDLAPMGDAGTMLASIAAMLGMAAEGEVETDALIAFLSDRRALIVLDNCERMVGPAAALAEAILAGAPGIHVLATSREPLATAGEWIVRLEPLSTPGAADRRSLAEVMAFAAARMFVERARASGDAFAPTDEDAPLLASICESLDGIPLALELAAGRVDSLGLRAMAENLKGRYRLIMQGRRNAEPRHRTLRSTLDWSYDGLPEREQTLLRRFGVFNAAAPIDSLIAMADGTGLAPAEVTEAVANLVGKSLLVGDVGGSVTRYRLLETTRIYALEKLREAGEADMARRLHAAHVLSFSRDALEDDAERRLVELRAALEWANSDDGDPALAARLAVAAVPLWNGHAPGDAFGDVAFARLMAGARMLATSRAAN